VPVRGQQARALTRYLRRQVRAYSPHYRPVLDRAFRERGGRSGIDFDNLPITSWSAVNDPRPFVLHPDESSITRHGEPRLALRVLFARLTGRTAVLARDVIDPVYKPIHWLLADGVPIGSSTRDLDRLAELGRHWLEQAGVRPLDVVVSVVPTEPTLGYWELVLATRRAGLSAAFLPPDATLFQVARLRPTVLAGRAPDLERILSGPPEDLDQVRVVLVVDSPLDAEQRRRLEAGVSDDAVVLSAWAPPGVRSLWTECPARAGKHTSPAAEYVGVGDDEVVWTTLGWSGSVLVRLGTGVQGAIVRGPCAGCGQSTPRVVVEALVERPPRPATPPAPTFDVDVPLEEDVEDLEDELEEPEPEPEPEPAPEPAPTPAANGRPPAFARLLDGHPGVALWQAELRTVEDAEELLVFFSPAGADGPVPVLTDLAEELAVTQFVVLSEDELQDRLDRHDHRQVVDLRSR
jgi:hypothetical protein